MRPIALLMVAAGVALAQPTPSNWQAMQVTGPTAGEYNSTYFEVTAPGFFVTRVQSGTTEALAHDEFEGVSRWWNLPTDPSKVRNLASAVCGLHQDQITYDGGQWFAANGSNFYEWIAGHGTVELLEANAIRVRVRYTARPTRFGVSYQDVSPDLTVTQDFTYIAPDSEFRRYHVIVDGGLPITNFGLNAAFLMSTRDGVNGGDIVDITDRSPIPWSLITPDDNYAGDQWLGLAAIPGETLDYVSGSTVAFPESGFYAVHPSTGFTGGWNRSKPSVTGSCSAGVCPASSLGGWPVYGAARNFLSSSIASLPSGGEVVFHSLSAISAAANLTTRAAAAAVDASYRIAAAPTMQAGTCASNAEDIENCFDYALGAYRMTAADSKAVFTSHAATRYPVFQIAGWSGDAPAKIAVAGVQRTKDVDYTAIKLDSTTLLLQYRYQTAAETFFQIDPSAPPASGGKAHGKTALSGAGQIK